jgi:hypothetical protein
LLGRKYEPIKWGCMRNAKINLLNSSEKTLINIEFDEQEYDVLHEYLEEIKRVRESKVVKSRLKVSIKITASVNDNIDTNENIPNDDDLYVLLHLLRPFLLNDESLNFGKITNMLVRRIKNDLIAKLIEQYKAKYSGKSLRSILQISVDDNVLDIDKYLEKYLNGLEYHRDKKKQTEIKQFFEYFPDNIGKALILSLIMDKANAILEIGNLIAAVFDENKVIEIL